MIAGLYDLEETIGELSYSYEYDTRKQYHSRVIPHTVNKRCTGVPYKIYENSKTAGFYLKDTVKKLACST
jgi:hypothetical protein